MHFNYWHVYVVHESCEPGDFRHAFLSYSSIGTQFSHFMNSQNDNFPLRWLFNSTKSFFEFTLHGYPSDEINFSNCCISNVSLSSLSNVLNISKARHSFSNLAWLLIFSKRSPLRNQLKTSYMWLCVRQLGPTPAYKCMLVRDSNPNHLLIIPSVLLRRVPRFFRRRIFRRDCV